MAKDDPREALITASKMEKDPLNFLLLEPLLEQHGQLKLGQLINVFPPFVLKESEQGVSMRASPVFDQISFLADLSRQIRGLKDETPITLRVLKKPTRQMLIIKTGARDSRNVATLTSRLLNFWALRAIFRSALTPFGNPNGIESSPNHVESDTWQISYSATTD